MSFSAHQEKQLAAPLNRAHVKERAQAGQTLSYIEGHHAIREANRIFGFDGWSSETLDLKCVSERERQVGKGQWAKQGWGVTYTARVRITVRAGEHLITREGTGAGNGIETDLGAAHEKAIKEAETDARKRALMTFGDPFGLALYDKEQRNVSDGEGGTGEGDEPPTAPPEPTKAATNGRGKGNGKGSGGGPTVETSTLPSPAARATSKPPAPDIPLDFGNGLEMVPVADVASRIYEHLVALSDKAAFDEWRDANKVGRTQFHVHDPRGSVVLRQKCAAFLASLAAGRVVEQLQAAE